MKVPADQLKLLAVPAVAGLLGVSTLLAANYARRTGPELRTFELTESLKVEPEGKDVRIWLPVPRESEHQTVEVLEVDAPVPVRRTTDPDFGNRTIYLEADGTDPVTVKTRYRITRRERSRESIPPLASLSPKERTLYSSARGLVAIDDEVRRIAANAAAGESDPIRAARRLYGAVLKRMTYDKVEPGWGKGSSLRACWVKKGNCTDFHSLYLALMRSRGIPARFLMGVPVTADHVKDLGRKYHCWAEFHVSGLGWIPVDISEAWKRPLLRGYYFGSLDAGRITFSIGRDITLVPPQAGRPLNYLAFPYVEVGGRRIRHYDLVREVKTIAPLAEETGGPATGRGGHDEETADSGVVGSRPGDAVRRPGRRAPVGS